MSCCCESRNELSAKIAEALKEKRPVMLASLAQQFEVSERQIAEAMPEDMAKVISGEHFATVWAALTSWEKATFIVQHGGHVIEIKTRIAPGKFGHGYYNIMGQEAVGGHIKADAITHISFLSMPFMGLESHSVQFFDADGHVAFSIYAGRGDDRKILPEIRDSFLAIKASF